GPEIPEGVRNRIFENGYTTKGSNGSGYGLYISKNLVEKRGGTVSLTGTARLNTSFEITLPKNKEKLQQ
ncbi:MAG: ATP-binding protein, partial [Eubacteriales bacterium]